MSHKSIKDLPIEHKRVLLRVDFNVPLDGKTITDTTRIDAALPTIEYILSRHAKLIIMSHLGRPKGKIDLKYSLKPCADYLTEKLGQPVQFAPNCVGAQVDNLKDGDVLLLENLRFHKGEEKPNDDPSFAQSLASLADFYVNDAFGTAHRKHASTYSVAEHFKGKCALGFLMEKEVQMLKTLLTKPKRPFFALVGGAKVGSKIGVLRSLLDKADHLFIGGGMAYTFLHTEGMPIGTSLFDEENVDLARDLAEVGKDKISLPLDFVITDGSEIKSVTREAGIPDGWEGVDIGEKTREAWKKEFGKCETFFWNGPVGIFERPEFAKGTEAVAHAIAEINGTTIAGGGDSVSAVQQLHLAHHFTHISTGGGACLEFIEYGHLPGLDVQM